MLQEVGPKYPPGGGSPEPRFTHCVCVHQARSSAKASNPPLQATPTRGASLGPATLCKPRTRAAEERGTLKKRGRKKRKKEEELREQCLTPKKRGSPPQREGRVTESSSLPSVASVASVRTSLATRRRPSWTGRRSARRHSFVILSCAACPRVRVMCAPCAPPNLFFFRVCASPVP